MVDGLSWWCVDRVLVAAACRRSVCARRPGEIHRASVRPRLADVCRQSMPGPGTAGVGDDAVVSLFGDRAPDLILLAEDEARMLGRSRVEPVHLLLAFARHGQVSDLLGERGITALAQHTAALGRDGEGSA